VAFFPIKIFRLSMSSRISTDLVCPPAKTCSTREWRFLGYTWVVIVVLLGLQLAVTASRVPGQERLDMIGLALLDWGPWLLLAPGVLWFSRRESRRAPGYGPCRCISRLGS
jgi:hypothetical protein